MSLVRFLLAFTVACGGSSSFQDVRIGNPRPERAQSCDVTWLSLDDQPANTRDEIAWVHLRRVGNDPLSATNREAVRRRACALGGDGVSLVSSTAAEAIYLVWATSTKGRASDARNPAQNAK